MDFGTWRELGISVADMEFTWVHSIVVAARARTFFLRLRNFDALLAPYFQLAILRDLPVALVLGNRYGPLAVRRRAQGVARRRPEVERRAVSHDLPVVVR